MKKIPTLSRTNFSADTTLGVLLEPNGAHLCYTLEDVVRSLGVKVKGETAIPYNDGETLYHVGVRESPKYGEVVVIYAEEKNGVYTLAHGGISFKYILMHGGNDHEDTEGCVLVAKNRSVKDMQIWGSQKTQILNYVKGFIDAGHDVYLRVK